MCVCVCARRAVADGHISLSRCSCCDHNSPSSWITSSPTPGLPNNCPSPTYSSAIHLCLEPQPHDGQDQAGSRSLPSHPNTTGRSSVFHLSSVWPVIVSHGANTSEQTPVISNEKFPQCRSCALVSYLHAHTRVRTHTHTHTHTYTYTHTRVHTRLHTCTHTHTYTRVHTRRHLLHNRSLTTLLFSEVTEFERLGELNNHSRGLSFSLSLMQSTSMYGANMHKCKDK